MPKPSHRETILTEGLLVVLERGFCGANVRDVVQAAGVPQGSFTNHFPSKEVFGLEILYPSSERLPAYPPSGRTSAPPAAPRWRGKRPERSRQRGERARRAGWDARHLRGLLGSWTLTARLSVRRTETNHCVGLPRLALM